MRYIKINFINSEFLFGRNVLTSFMRKNYQSTSSEITSLENEISDVEEIIEPKKVDRNKSGLLPQHRNMLMNKVPYNEPQSWIHLTEKYQRKLFGRYGLESNINPRICFYLKEDKELREEYERVAYPHTIQEMIENNKKEKQAQMEAIKKREDDIIKKLNKLDQWKNELTAKIAKKEKEALEAKQRKERLVEEVRRHFGFKVDPRDERFKELLEQKEKEDRKKQKEAKKKAKEEKAMAKLLDAQKGNKDKKPTKAEVKQEDEEIENEDEIQEKSDK